MNVENFFKIDDKIYTSGLPNINDFECIAKKNFKIVISLTMPTDSKVIKNEEQILTKLNITYIHIPVNFYKPKIEDFKIFLKIINIFKDEKLWIHCTKNYRVTTFIYLYKLIELKEDDKKLLETFWKPNETWQKFIKDVRNS